MTDLLERLRRDDPAALEELGHALLPFVQAAVLAQTFEARDPVALLQMFRDEVALATRSSDATTFFSTVLNQMRARAPAIAAMKPDASQTEALARLKRLEPLPVIEREIAIARFVERLPEPLNVKQFGLDGPALANVLSRGADLLVGPPAALGETWTSEPSLLDPDAAPVAQFVELENVLTCLAIDVTALERMPVMAPVPVLKPGFEPQVPQDHYPSKVVTQGFVDVPAEVSSFTPGVPPPRPSGSRPSVVVSPDVGSTTTGQTPQRTHPLWDEGTEPQGVAIVPPPGDRTEATAPRAHPLPAAPFSANEHTETNARPLPLPVPWPVDETVTGGKALSPPPAVVPHPGRPINDGKGYFAEVESEKTEVRVSTVALPVRALPFHQRLPAAWWLGAAAFCALLGTSLYWGMVSYVQVKVQRPWTMVPVIAAAKDLPEGTKITLEMLAIRGIPSSNASVSVVKPDSIEYALGKTLEFPLQAGDPLLWAQFDGAWKYKRFNVVKRARAYTVAVTELKSLGGNLLPNEEIDLVLTINETPLNPKEKAQGRALTLLQRVRILAVGAVTTLNIGRVQRRFSHLTLLLMPEEVEVLSLAQRAGDLTATLRNGDDDDLIERGSTTLQTLLSGVRLKQIERKRGAVIAQIRESPRR